MLARCVIIRVHLSWSRRCTSIDPPTDTYQHDTYYLVEYGEIDLTISPVFSRESFRFISSVPRLILVKALGHLLILSYPIYFVCLLIFCCLNQKPLSIYL